MSSLSFGTCLLAFKRLFSSTVLLKQFQELLESPPSPTPRFQLVIQNFGIVEVPILMKTNFLETGTCLYI